MTDRNSPDIDGDGLSDPPTGRPVTAGGPAARVAGGFTPAAVPDPTGIDALVSDLAQSVISEVRWLAALQGLAAPSAGPVGTGEVETWSATTAATADDATPPARTERGEPTPQPEPPPATERPPAPDEFSPDEPTPEAETSFAARAEAHGHDAVRRLAPAEARSPEPASTMPFHDVTTAAAEAATPLPRVADVGDAAGARGGEDQPPDWRRMARTGLRFAGYALAGYLALVAVLIVLYRFVDPPGSTLMALQWLQGRSIDQRWVAIEDMSASLVRAVVVAEDGRFCQHYGIDLAAIEEAIENSSDGFPRGASTISMQVAKNLFLWPSKSYLRKAIEVPVTLAMEALWPKRRVLELYLNVAEWGPGIFGAEAAAQHHFRKSASRLSPRESALLAASLPNPIVRDAGDPGPRVARKATVIDARVRRAGADAFRCVLAASWVPRIERGG